MLHGGIPASRAVLTARLGLYDVACCALAPVAAFLIREQGIATHTSASVITAYIATSALTSSLCVVLFDLSGIVSRFLSVRDVVRIAQASLLSVLASVMVLFIAFRLDEVPRGVPVLNVILLVATLVGGRMLARHRRRKKDRIGLPTGSNQHTHTIIVGANALTRAFIHMAREVTHSQEIVVGVLTPSGRLQGRRIAGCPVLGAPEQLSAIVAEYETHGLRIERVVVTDDSSAPNSAAWNSLRDCARQFAFDLEYLPHVLVPVFRPEIADVGDADLSAPASVPGSRHLYWTFRRAVDILGAGALLLLTLPLLVLITGAVLVELGFPAIFWQQRLGRGKRPVRVYKFRTLRSPFDRHGRARTGPLLGPIGGFLRASRLDELPQLWNIFLGEMSFIGPRPLLPVDQPDSVEKRLSVRPGLTGWAQVQGGRYLTRDAKAQLDLWYIDNASFALDLEIVLRTVAFVFGGDKDPSAESADATRRPDRTQRASLGLHRQDGVLSGPIEQSDAAGVAPHG